MVIRICLPLCNSSEQLTLDILEGHLHFESKEPYYMLDLELPYPISDQKAKFLKSERRLDVTLSVVPFTAILDLD